MDANAADFTQSLLPFYGLSAVLTVPVPEPSSMVTAILALVALSMPTFRHQQR